VRQRTDRERLRRFLEVLGRRLRRSVRFYLVGGSVLIDLGLRGSTIDIGYVAAADDPADLADLEQNIRALKNELDVNVEPASPADFLPIPRTILDRSRYIGREGRLEVYYYHLPSQVIAKAARGLEQDLRDAERLITAGEVAWSDVEETWKEISASRTVWIRYEPEEIEKRLELLRRRLDASSL
jgi:type II secretory pathway component PulJ